MSEKKSWDVVRRDPSKRQVPLSAPARADVARAPAPQRAAPAAISRRRTGLPQSMDIRRAPARPPREPEPIPFAKRATTKDVENPRGSRPRAIATKRQPLKVARKRREKRFWILLAILIAFLIAGAFYLLWLPLFRIQVVEADGPSSADLQSIATQDIHNSYFFVLPRSSIFLVPQKEIRAQILAAHPEIEAVTFSANGLNALVIHSIYQESAFWWCGSDITAQGNLCYQANPAGLVFASAPAADASSTAILRFYGPIDATSTDPNYPLGGHIDDASKIPNALRFVKAIENLNVNVASIVFRGDEADLYTANGTRITYVLGREDQAAGLAATAFPQLTVNDGSLEYIDLRFEGKVYYKKK